MYRVEEVENGKTRELFPLCGGHDWKKGARKLGDKRAARGDFLSHFLKMGWNHSGSCSARTEDLEFVMILSARKLREKTQGSSYLLPSPGG